jgi:hypothetical protein
MNLIKLSCCLGVALCVVNVISQLDAAGALPPVSISEFMADAEHGVRDEDGDLSGWIEIHNSGGGTVNLAGWFLTDSRANLSKWRLPSVSLLPEKYLLVFASGKDRASSALSLHTNFKLNERGGYLALVNRSTNVVSEFVAYPKQAPGTSYGHAPGDLASVGCFVHPTPGKPNMTRGSGFAPEVTFSRAGGTFTMPVTIEMSSSSSGAAIHYTTDGSLPNARSPVYCRPLEFTKTVYLRARAYEEGLLPGPPRSQTYLLLDPALRAFSSNLPLLIMDTFGQDLSDSERDSFVHLSFFEPTNGRASLTNLPTASMRAGFHARGSSTLNMAKTSFVMHFLDDFNEEQHRPILGLPADSDWVLYAPNQFEPVMIHNPFVHQLTRDLGRYSPRTRFLEIFFVNSAGLVGARHYAGIYVLEEKIKVGKHRVDIDRLGPADVKPPDVTGGYLLKLDRLGPGESGFWTGEASLVYVEPKERVISLPERAPQRQFLSTYFADFERALHGPNWRDPVLGYRAYIDVPAWIDYHVLEVLSGNVDAFAYSSYFYKPRNGKLVYGPHWDFDRALGSTDGRDDDPRRWNTGRFLFNGPWWNRLLRDPDFWQLWVDRWQELRQNQVTFEHINGLIDRLADELREAQPREVERWGLIPRGGSYQSEIDLMKEWLSNRIDFIDGQLVPKPALASPTGSKAPTDTISLVVTDDATVYYTLDGSDPRLAQGGISSNALTYSAPIQLTAEARLTARARNPAKRQIGGPRSSTPWSGPLTATLKVNPP